MSRKINHRCPISGKYRYAGPTEAADIAAKMTAKKGEKFKAYACSECVGWHVGHRRVRRGARKIAKIVAGFEDFDFGRM